MPALANPFRGRLRPVDSPAASAARTWATTLTLGSLTLTAAIASSSRLRFERHDGFTVVLGYGGDLQLNQGSRRTPCPAGALVALGGEAAMGEGEAWSVVAIQLPAASFLATCKAMGGGRGDAEQWRSRIANPLSVHLGSGDDAAVLQRALRRLLTICAGIAALGEDLLERLQLEAMIERLVAALLIPELRQPFPLASAREKMKSGHDPFAALLLYIQEHLGELLTLSDLEAQSHYSRRTLQYTFQQQLGCTASQWIRGQRLDRSRRRLEEVNAHDTVSAIAKECGYRSMSLFSLDFQQRFHVKPSQLLREARASHPV